MLLSTRQPFASLENSPPTKRMSKADSDKPFSQLKAFAPLDDDDEFSLCLSTVHFAQA
jgi:hypothetical protein